MHAFARRLPLQGSAPSSSRYSRSLRPRWRGPDQHHRRLASVPVSLMPCELNVRRVLGILSWIFQLLASLAWVISVFIYNSWEVGDVFQLIAASAWTLSNFLSLPEAFGFCEQKDVNETNSLEMSKVWFSSAHAQMNRFWYCIPHKNTITWVVWSCKLESETKNNYPCLNLIHCIQ